MISIFFSDIFDAKVVDDKGESDVMHRMLPEGGGVGDRFISKLSEVEFQTVIAMRPDFLRPGMTL